MKNNVATNQVISANLLLGCVVGGDYEDYNGLLIPVYQRNYTWEKKEIEELYDDFENHWNRNCKKEADGDFYMNDSSRRYYLGNVVVVKERGEKFGILDGQQRITTLYIMNAVFKAFFKKLREELNVLHIANKISLDKNAELKQEFKSYLESVNKISSGGSEPRLGIAYVSDKDHFKEILKESFNPSSLPDSLSRTHAMIKAYKILQKKVEETIQNYIKKTFKADIDEKHNFLARMHMVGQMSKYIRGDWTEFNLTILNKGQEFEIFETMNDRGKELNAFDLTRNAMISSSLKLEDPNAEDKGKALKETRERVKKLFDETIKENAKKGDSTRYIKNAADFMLQSWLVRSKEKISRKKYMGAFIEFSKSKDEGFDRQGPKQKKNLLNHVVFLERASQFHNEVLNPKNILKRKNFGSNSERKKLLKKLQLINMTGLRQFIPIYIGLRLVMCNPQQIIKWLDLIEKIYVNGYLVFAYSPAKFESHLHNAAYRVYKSGLFQTNVDEGYEQIKGYDREKLDNAHYELKKSINDLIGLENQDYRTTFINQMSTIQISNNKTINYLLRRIEVFTRGETEEIILDDELTVEHILPNYYKKNWKNVPFYNDKKNMLNLENNLSGSTIHSQFVNRLGNHTLLTKKWNSSLRDSPFHTKKEKLSNSDFKINNHPDQPISVCFYKDWNADSIVKRQKELAKKGLEIWGLDI